MSLRPIGYFVHHQGRGHAERCAALVNALPEDRPVTIFCAKPDVLPTVRAGVDVVAIPSLFEPTGGEARGMDHVPQPDTVHCAPLGWPGIRRAMATLAEWFERAEPALIVSDVSAEVAQLARICSVPHVCVIQHGVRDDAGHRAAWEGAAGLLAPFDRVLAQEDWPEALVAKTCFAGGLGTRIAMPTRVAARERLGLDADERVHLVISGGGGEGFASAALGVGARTFPDAHWCTIGPLRTSWHATEPVNLVHHGWVDDAIDRLAAADLVVSSVGNTVCQQVLAAGVPWIAVPEWCYFDEQVCKARALGVAGFAHVLPDLPAHAGGWRDAVARAQADHDPAGRRAAVRDDADAYAADWLDGLCRSLWNESSRVVPAPEAPGDDARPSEADAATAHDLPAPSVLTIACGREAHLANLVLGLERQTRAPAELVIGVMQARPFEGLPAASFPIRQIPIPVTDEGLPLAAARNAVARHATREALVFLDVDCIPGPELVADYTARVRRGAGLLMGEVAYLPEGCAREGWTPAKLERCGVRHDSRAGPPETAVERCGDYRCFWSLNFAMHRAEFEAAGGFDESFTGYGGEDTDFGRTLQAKGIGISWMRGAKAFHQFHVQRMPPVHHVESVLANAERFADKWGERTMDHWLHCFGMMGLIEDTPAGLRLVRPAPEIDLALCEPDDDLPYASTNRVMERLETRAVERYRREHGRAPPGGWLDRKRFLHRPLPDAEPTFVGAGAR